MLPILIPRGFPRSQLLEVRDSSFRSQLLDHRSKLRKNHRLSLLKGDAFLLPKEKHDLFNFSMKELKASSIKTKGFTKTLCGLLNKPIRIIKMQARVWQCTETSLMMGFPEISEEVEYFISRFWISITNLVINNERTVPATKWYKQFSLLLRQKYLMGRDAKGLDKYPSIPKGTYLERFFEPCSPKEKRKRYVCIMSLMTYRNFPPGDLDEEVMSMISHDEILTLPPEDLTEGLALKLDNYGFIVGQEVLACAKRSKFFKRTSCHVSISNSSCLESERTKGGKRSFILSKLYNYLKEEVEQGYTLITNIGREYKFEKGIPRWKTFSHNETEDVEFNTPVPDSGFIPKRYGLDEETLSNALWALSYEECHKMGFIDEKGNATNKPYNTERSTVREPGGKIRIVTKANAFLVTYLQPAAHYFTDFLSSDPTLSAGFKRAYQAFEWYKRMVNSNLIFKEDEYLVLGDFEKATDFLQRNRAAKVINGFIRGAEIDSSYLKSCLAIILGDWTVSNKLSLRGCPMGMPCTKIILHILSKTISVISQNVTECRTYKELLYNPFAAAGDDLIDIGDEKHSKRMLDATAMVGLKPSNDKWGSYKEAGPYCEVLLCPKIGIFTHDYQCGDRAILDMIRLRLISPETKPQRGDQDRNPIFGKMFGFMKELQWTPNYYPDYLDRAFLIFARNFRRYIRQDGVVPHNFFLPRYLGGLGYNPTIEEFKYHWDKVPEWHKNLIAHLVDEKGQRESALRVLSSWSTPMLSERGIGRNDIYSNELYIILQEYLPCISLTDAYIDVEADHPHPDEKPRYFDKVKWVKKHGYSDIRSLVSQLSSIPFWEQKVNNFRGWPKRTFSERNEILRKFSESLPKLEHKFTELDLYKLSQDKLRLEGRYFIKNEYMNYFDIQSFSSRPLNLNNNNTGAKVFISIPNKDI